MERVIKIKNSVYQCATYVYQRVSLAKTWKWSIALALLVLLIFGYRSCSKTLMPDYYKIARDTTWHPLNLFGKEKNVSVFANELLTRIAAVENLNLETVDVPSSDLYAYLDDGDYDGVIGSLTPNATNQEKYLFSDPFMRIGPVLVVPIHSNVKTLEDLKGKLIGFYSNSSLFLNMTYSSAVHIVPYSGPVAALEDLDKGMIDAVVINAIPAYIYIKSMYNDKLKIAGPPMTPEGFRLITRHSPRNKILIDKFNEGLKKIRDSGEFETLVNKWSLISLY